MSKKKVYAVKKGRNTGIFRTWEECRTSVDGYPGAEYKGFRTDEEAEEYLSGAGRPGMGAPSGDMEKVDANQSRLIAYVDGSFDEKVNRYAFGCVIITPGGEMIREFGNGENPESLALRNVAGEMLGAMYAVKWCDKNGYSEIELCYDYTGIEMWATGEWKAKNNLTKKYADFMKDYCQRINISFRKIAAHTGDKYNEEADKLAKRGLIEGEGIPRIHSREQ